MTDCLSAIDCVCALLGFVRALLFRVNVCRMEYAFSTAIHVNKNEHVKRQQVYSFDETVRRGRYVDSTIG